MRLRATADVWLSDASPKERRSSSGKNPRLKLKTIQEMSAIRFDASPVRGREVLRATLYLRRAGSDMLRYIRVSTVNQDWVEGDTENAYGPPSGATYLYADATTRRPWAWTGSEFADVIMGSGHTIAHWAERRELEDGWIAVDLTPSLIYALAIDDTDGLAIMDGGNLSYANNFLYSVQSPESAPYIEVELGGPIGETPGRPVVTAAPAPDRSHLDSGAIRVVIAPSMGVFAWRIALNGEPVERWRVPHPSRNGPTRFTLEGLTPSESYALEVVAVAPGGQRSAPATLTVSSSPALEKGPSLGAIAPPRAVAPTPEPLEAMRVWAYPGLVKVSPIDSAAMFGDVADDIDYRRANAVWDGSRIRLFGARGEVVSYQLDIERSDTRPLVGVRVVPGALVGPGEARITASNIDLYRNWYARNRDDRWQPAYLIPMNAGTAFDIPDSVRGIAGQRNQSVYVDVYIPKDAPPGTYEGSVTVTAEGVPAVSLPVTVAVYDFALPDRLSFLPELNAYRIPKHAVAYYRLAQENRAVFNPWRWTPKVEGVGKEIRVLWDEYDRQVGPLLTGEAFADSRRGPIPVEVMYLPFFDSWPTQLTKETYRYDGYWPGRGEDRRYLIEHSMRAPYIGDALSPEYLDAFRAVERQFIEHFEEKGYTQTEMQSFFGGKSTHRINYGSNMWWTTDEPYHWEDWLALQFFDGLWTRGRGRVNRRRWPARADISRPQWQDRVLDGIVDVVYYGAGAFGTPAMQRRARTLARETGFTLRTYGSANADNESNTRSVAWILTAWLNGAEGVLPWQTLGPDESLDRNDRAAGGGNALLVPGDRFGLDVVGDMRLKALRDGQQLTEYLTLLATRRDLTREQIRAMVADAVPVQSAMRRSTRVDDAESLQSGPLKTWQIAGLRRRIAELLIAR